MKHQMEIFAQQPYEELNGNVGRTTYEASNRNIGTVTL